MAISRPCYCSRDETMRSIDIQDGTLSTPQVDRAIASASDKIEGRMMRRFYPIDTIRFFDWPNYQYAYPWRYWFGKQDCCALTLLQSPGNSGGTGGVSIPLYQVFLEPVNRDPGFPFRSIELDRSTVAAWGIGPTPQHSIWATGTWGFTADADPVATLAASIGASDTTFAISDGSQCGAGDLLIIGYGRGTAPYPTYLGTAGAVQPYLGERVIVQEKTAAPTGLTQTGAGCSTMFNGDNQLATTGTGTLHPGEVIQLDGEQMLVETVIAGIATVERAWNGTVLADHSNAAVYAMRQLTVLRGQCGTAAASATTGTSVARHRPPQLIRDLAIAASADQVMQELSGYSRTVGSGEAQMRASGYALADLWDQAARRFGRQQRIGAI